MKAIIKDLHSPDIFDLENYQPDLEDNFCFLLQVLIGPERELGDESFDFTVCTPKWLIQNHKKESVLFLRHYIVVFEYNYNQLMKALKNKIENISGEQWTDIAMNISRIGCWEFEDYNEL